MEVLAVTGFVLWALLLVVASLFVYLGLGGNFIVLGLALIHALATGFTSIGWGLLAVLLGLALLGELVEFILGNFYVVRKGASRPGFIGAFTGGLLGAVLGNGVVPVVGALLGSFVGAFLGAVTGEYVRQRRIEPSLRIGGHAFLGRMLSLLFKHAVSLVMVFLILRATWPIA